MFFSPWASELFVLLQSWVHLLVPELYSTVFPGAVAVPEAKAPWCFFLCRDLSKQWKRIPTLLNLHRYGESMSLLFYPGIHCCSAQSGVGAEMRREEQNCSHPKAGMSNLIQMWEYEAKTSPTLKLSSELPVSCHLASLNLIFSFS